MGSLVQTEGDPLCSGIVGILLRRYAFACDPLNSRKDNQGRYQNTYQLFLQNLDAMLVVDILRLAASQWQLSEREDFNRRN